MDLSRAIIYALLAWLVVPSFIQFYFAFKAPRCPENAKAAACFKSLFQDGEKVDVSVYVTTDRKIKWWTPQGFKDLEKGHVWNTTGLTYGATVKNTSITLPLSAEHLQGVRRNESMLVAHCFMVRGGKSIAEMLTETEADATLESWRKEHKDIRKLVNSDIEAKPEHLVWPHLLHASHDITRRLPLKRQSRRNLLGNGTDEDDIPDGDDVLSVTSTVPGLGWTVTIFPNEALMWTLSLFSLGSFITPNAYMAAIRHVLTVAAVLLFQERRTLQQVRQAKVQKENELDAQWWRLQGPEKLVPHIVPKLRVNVAVDEEVYDARHPPPLLYKEMQLKDPFNPQEKDIRYRLVGKPNSKVRRYVPPMAIETWGLQQRYWRPLDSNISKSDPKVAFEFDVTGMWRYTVMQTIKETMKAYMQFGFTERDLDDMRDFMFRHPLHIMVIMQVIGFAQMILTTLAFKNDVSFFRGRKDYVGLSSRSLATDTIQEIIIFLYLLDYDDISRIVLFQVGTGAAISAWKYVRVAKLQLNWSYMLPWLRSARGEKMNSIEAATEDIDAKGMRYLKFALYPLSALWGIYNLYYYSYKSWWSWAISSLADFAYTFGFVNMMPQIFINYKLKSVAHMPWRVLGYKFFNTFIDDVFAFFIMSDYMTKKHRYMTLRDDIIFFIFLYQRYLYPVDPNRADEYGYVYNEEAAVGASEKQKLSDCSDGGRAQQLDAKFEMFVDKADEHRWRLRAASGSTMLVAAHGYSEASACQDAIEQVRCHGKLEDNFSRTQKDDALYFEICNDQKIVLGRSRDFKTAAGDGVGQELVDAIESVRAVVGNAPVQHVEDAEDDSDWKFISSSELQ